MCSRPGRYKKERPHEPASSGTQKINQFNFRRKRGICKEMKTVKVTTDNKISVIDVNFNDFRAIQRAIGGHFETVHTQLMADYFKDPSVIMLVDEEGLIKELPLNPVGSALYRSVIAGDLIFAQVRGDDIVAPDDVKELKDRLLHTFTGLQEE